MRIYSGKNEISDKKSDKYIEINNCGCIEAASPKLHVLRERGRLDWQLIYIKKGAVEFFEKNKKITLRGGNVYLYRPGETQSYMVSKENTDYYWIHFSGTEVENMLSFFKENYANTGAFPEFEEMCLSYTEDYRTKGAECDLLYQGKFVCLIAQIKEKTKALLLPEQDYSVLNSAINYINKNFNIPLTNEDYAKMCGISKYYFIHLFKKAMGCTPQSYKSNLLIDKAKFLLRNTTLNISEIAESLGFSDSLYFSRFFKKHTNFSPKSYRLNR